MADVLFITPADQPYFRCESLGTLILASLLNREGIKAEILRFYEIGEQKDFDAFIGLACESILKKKPSIVSFYCRCDCFLPMIRIAEKLKQLSPDIPIVFGGPQADASHTETIEELPFVDYCCSGEGETTVYPLFHGLLHGEDVTGIDGLTYRLPDGSVKSNPRPPMLENLDDSPRVDYHLVPKEILENHYDTRISLDVGRGCPFNCVFCSSKLFWNRNFRMKSTERMLSEIRELYEKWGFNSFNFAHDLFTGSKKRILDFCNQVTESGMKVSWTCSSRVDTVDEEMIDAMTRAGLTGVFIGVESGSPEIQKKIKKNLKMDDVVNTTRLFLEHGVEVTASFMYGFPEETEQDISATMKVAFQLLTMGVNSVPHHLCAIMQGTELFERYRDELIFAPAPSDQVGDFGIKENMSYINEHKRLFPYYYEYRNPIRQKFEGLGLFMWLCECDFKLCHPLLTLYKPESLTDFYLDFYHANRAFFDKDQAFWGKYLEIRKTRFELFNHYAESKLEGNQLVAYKALLQYYQDYELWLSSPDAKTEIHTYHADVRTIMNENTLDSISDKDAVVVFTVSKNGKRVVSFA